MWSEGSLKMYFQETRSLVLAFHRWWPMQGVQLTSVISGKCELSFRSFFSMTVERKLLRNRDWLHRQERWNHPVIRGTHRRSNWQEPQDNMRILQAFIWGEMGTRIGKIGHRKEALTNAKCFSFPLCLVWLQLFPAL